MFKSQSPYFYSSGNSSGNNPETSVSSKALIYSELSKYSLFLVMIFIPIILAFTFFWDQSITHIFKQDDLKWLIARNITNVGLFSHYFIIGLIMLIISWLFSKPILKEKSKLLLISLLASGLVTHIFKFSIGRQRPKISETFEPHIFNFLTTHWDNHSFPSGHSQVLWTVATYLSFEFPKFKWVFYGLASILSFTRVMTRDHFMSDVLGGLLVGHLTTLWCIYYFKFRKSH